MAVNGTRVCRILSSAFPNRDAGGEADTGDSGTASPPDGLVSITSFGNGESDGVILISDISLAKVAISLPWELFLVWMILIGESGTDTGMASVLSISGSRSTGLES